MGYIFWFKVFLCDSDDFNRSKVKMEFIYLERIFHSCELCRFNTPNKFA